MNTDKGSSKLRHRFQMMARNLWSPRSLWFSLHFLICVHLCSSVAQTAFAGTVTTLDGRSFEGEVKFDTRTALGVVQKNGVGVRVELDKLLRATFEPVSSKSTEASRSHEILLARGIVTADGTAIAVENFLKVDKQTVRVTKSDTVGGGEATLRADRVARIVLAPLPDELLVAAPAGKSGVILDGGDFAEGELVNVDNGKVKLNSILFGPQSFECGTRALAVILRPARRPDESARLVMTLADGSVLAGDAITTERGRASIDDSSFGAVSAPIKDVIEIRAGGERLVPLETVKGVASAAAAGPVPLFGLTPAHAVAVRAGSPIAIDLDGKYESFIARVGVPLAIAPARPARVVLLVDGVERFRSEPLTSVDDPVPVAVSLKGTKKLELRVDEGGPAVVLADPVLVTVAAQ